MLNHDHRDLSANRQPPTANRQPPTANRLLLCGAPPNQDQQSDLNKPASKNTQLATISTQSAANLPAERSNKSQDGMRQAQTMQSLLKKAAFWLGGAAIGATALGLLAGPWGILGGAVVGFLLFPGMFITSGGNPPNFNNQAK